MRRVQIAVMFDIDTDDWESQFNQSHFGTWIRALLETEFRHHDVRNLKVVVEDMPKVN